MTDVFNTAWTDFFLPHLVSNICACEVVCGELSPHEFMTSWDALMFSSSALCHELLSLPSSFSLRTSKACLFVCLHFFFSGFCLSACPDCPSLSPSFYLSFRSVLAWTLPLCLPRSVFSCIWPWNPRMDSLDLANGSRLVSLCKYLHRGIIDGPTHSRWSPSLLQATLGQRMVLSVTWT